MTLLLCGTVFRAGVGVGGATVGSSGMADLGFDVSSSSLALAFRKRRISLLMLMSTAVFPLFIEFTFAPRFTSVLTASSQLQNIINVVLPYSISIDG